MAKQCPACGGSHEHARPEGYKGLLYDEITPLHRKYLRALALACDRAGAAVTEEEWLAACQEEGVKTNEGTIPQKISPAMYYGVFEYHGLVDVYKGKPRRFKVTGLGRQNI